MRTIVIPFKPRLLQRDTLRQMRRFNALVMHRRFGKTVLCVNRLIRRTVSCPLPQPQTAYIAPYLKQAKQIAWEYLKYYAAPIPGIKFYRADLQAVLPNGGRIMLAGADNPDRMRGIYLDDCILDECAQMAPSMFGEIIRPALSDREGGCTFLGTPKGKGNFYRICRKAEERMLEGDPEWYFRVLRASETNVIPLVELNKIKREISAAEYEQEYECSWTAAVRGAYWAEEIAQAERDHRVGDVPYLPEYPVHTAWDLGLHDALIVWYFQIINGQFRFLAVSEHHQGLPEVCADVIKRPYKIWGSHVFPHDINVTELGSGVRRWDVVRRLLPGACVVAKNIGLADGIEAARMIIARCAFSVLGCRDGIDALSLYRAEYDEINDVTHSKPLHDWTSHYADAFRYAAVYFGGNQVATTGREAEINWGRITAGAI